MIVEAVVLVVHGEGKDVWEMVVVGIVAVVTIERRNRGNGGCRD